MIVMSTKESYFWSLRFWNRVIDIINFVKQSLYSSLLMSVLRRWFCCYLFIVCCYMYSHCLWVLSVRSLFCSTLCHILFCYHIAVEERAGCFVNGMCWLFLGFMGWFVVCDCGISWIYALTFCKYFFKFYLVAALLYLLIRIDILSGSSAGRWSDPGETPSLIFHKLKKCCGAL